MTIQFLNIYIYNQIFSCKTENEAVNAQASPYCLLPLVKPKPCSIEEKGRETRESVGGGERECTAQPVRSLQTFSWIPSTRENFAFKVPHG